MSDLEREPKARGRPQSIIAQRFSVALDTAFGLDGTFELAQSVQDKKLAVNTQNAELEALEARLKAMEERLKAQQLGAPALNKITPRQVDQRQQQQKTESFRQLPSTTSKQTTQSIPASGMRSYPNSQQTVLVDRTNARKPESSEEEEEDEDESEEDEEESEEEESEEDESATEESSSESDAK